MKRYRVATWARNGTIPFIYKNKAYALEAWRDKSRCGTGFMDVYYTVTDGKNTVKFDWREVKVGHDLDEDPEGITIYFCEGNKALNKCAKWLDEQVLKGKEMIDIDDMIISGKRPNVLGGKVEYSPDWYDAREELPINYDDVLVSTSEDEVGIGHYNSCAHELMLDSDIDGTIKGWMPLPDAYDWRANKEACEYDEEYQQQLEDAHWDDEYDRWREEHSQD